MEVCFLSHICYKSKIFVQCMMVFAIDTHTRHDGLTVVMRPQTCYCECLKCEGNVLVIIHLLQKQIFLQWLDLGTAELFSVAWFLLFHLNFKERNEYFGWMQFHISWNKEGPNEFNMINKRLFAHKMY